MSMHRSVPQRPYTNASARRYWSYDRGMVLQDPDSPRARGSYAKGIARRQEILDSAIEVFAQRGAGRTSLRAIAEEVGVTHAALIHHCLLYTSDAADE